MWQLFMAFKVIKDLVRMVTVNSGGGGGTRPGILKKWATKLEEERNSLSREYKGKGS